MTALKIRICGSGNIMIGEDIVFEVEKANSYV